MSKKEKKEGREDSAAPVVYDEVDDEGNVIDPDEPRYCVCHRVSFGVMINCENVDVSSLWCSSLFTSSILLHVQVRNLGAAQARRRGDDGEYV